jgi:hypothetical protein
MGRVSRNIDDGECRIKAGAGAKEHPGTLGRPLAGLKRESLHNKTYVALAYWFQCRTPSSRLPLGDIIAECIVFFTFRMLAPMQVV